MQIIFVWTYIQTYIISTLLYTPVVYSGGALSHQFSKLSQISNQLYFYSSKVHTANNENNSEYTTDTHYRTVCII